jgi:hypothetical protein
MAESRSGWKYSGNLRNCCGGGTEQKMEIMKIGGILLVAGLAVWIVKSVFVWWRERQDAKKWWGQYEAETNAWDKRRELESSHESEDNARRR